MTHSFARHLPPTLLPGAPVTRHLLLPVVPLGLQGVVSGTHEPHIADAVVTPSAEGPAMVMEFQAVAGPAAPSPRVDVGTPAFVARVHRAPDGGWDVAQSIEYSQQLRQLGVDLVDVSSGGLTERQQIEIRPGFFPLPWC